MTLQEYIVEKAKIAARIARFVLLLLRPFLRFRLGPNDWNALLYTAFPEVRRARYEAAELGRAFYDSTRQNEVGRTRDVFLDPYDFEMFAESMEPVRAKLVSEDSQDDALVEAVNRTVKEVENGGRRTLIRAVETDSEAVGWARYDPRPPTCAFCTMLISRGAVYLSAKSGGAANLEDKPAQQLWDRGGANTLDAFMTRWHPGCTCLVIPVYDEERWEGRDQFLAAERLWRQATKGYRGLDALNALRRAIAAEDERGTALPKAA